MIRLFLLTFFLFFSCNLFATEEIQRIDAIVDDIEKLRHSYEKQLFDLKEKNIVLEHENSVYKKKITHLKNQIKELNKQLKRQKKSPKTKVIVKEKIKKIVIRQPLCEDENKFPTLKLKKSTQAIVKKSKKVEIIHFKASAFRLREDANIYAGIRSLKTIGKWEKGTSFTSNVRTQTRVKITGYFVNKVWKKADKEMWVERSRIQKR